MPRTPSAKTLTALALAATLAACGSAPTAPAGPVTAPTQAAGMSGDVAVGLVDLAAHKMPGTTADYDLRARAITLAPDGGAPAHPHAGRPGIVRVVKGTVVEGRGSAQRTLKAGDFWLENHDTTHWFRNPSQTEAAELWIVDIVPKKK